MPHLQSQQQLALQAPKRQSFLLCQLKSDKVLAVAQHALQGPRREVQPATHLQTWQRVQRRSQQRVLFRLWFVILPWRWPHHPLPL